MIIFTHSKMHKTPNVNNAFDWLTRCDATHSFRPAALTLLTRNVFGSTLAFPERLKIVKLFGNNKKMTWSRLDLPRAAQTLKKHNHC